MNKSLKFGEMVYGPFPFADADGEKSRWVLVLGEQGDRVLVAYCTTNPEWPGAFRLGALPFGDNKVSNLFLRRLELVQKERLNTVKGVHSAPGLYQSGLLETIVKMARLNQFGELSASVSADATAMIGWRVAALAKKAAKSRK